MTAIITSSVRLIPPSRVINIPWLESLANLRGHSTVFSPYGPLNVTEYADTRKLVDERGVVRPAASGFLAPQNLLLMLGLAMQTLKDAIVKAIDTREQAC